MMAGQSSPLGLRVSVYNRRLKLAIEESGLTMKDLAGRVGVQPQIISAITTLRYKPRPILRDAIALELGYTVEYLFPSAVTALSGRHTAVELPLTEADLLQSAILADPRSQIEDAEMRVDHEILRRAVATALAASLTNRERQVLTLRYGLGGGRPHTQQEVALLYNITPSRVGKIEERLMEKLHKPRITRLLRPYL